MLEFFRKHQRIFLIFVTIIIIVTFSLFGTYKTIGQMESKKEIIVCQAIDGSKLKYQEIKILSAILGAERGDNGVIVKEFIQTGAGERLSRAFFNELKGDWQSRLERIRRYRFYVHPEAPFINAKDIWNQRSPGTLEQIRDLQTMSEVQNDFFPAWSRLYAMQEKCPPELIRRILFYHQNQYQISRDPRILADDFSICGFQTVHDWFGPNFTDLCVEMILNGAIEAEAKGFQASKGDALDDLTRRFSFKDANLDYVLRSIGVRKTDAIDLWQRVLVYLRYFRSIGQAAMIDDLAYQRFADFAHETAHIDVYHLPNELRFKTLNDFLSFEIYSKLCCAPCDLLSMPSSWRTVDEVVQTAPQLVASKYSVKVAQLDLNSLMSRLSLSEVWDWQLEAGNWEKMLKTFPEIAALSGKSHFKMLENLDPLKRAAIDDWSRHQIVEAHPEWMAEALSQSPGQDLQLYIFANDEISPLPIQNVAVFRSLIEESLKSNDAAIQSLKVYREDQTIYCISEVKKVSDPEILSLIDAKKLGRINIDAYLEAQYLHLKKSNPSLFQDEHGDFRPFGDVKETVIRQVFSPQFLAIDQALGQSDLTLDEYAHHRWYPFMQQELVSLMQHSHNDSGLWTIDHTEQTIERSSSEDWIMKEPFILQAGDWSDVYVPPDGDIVFFFMSERSVPQSSVLEQIQRGKETLAAEAQCLLVDQIIANALKKQAIVLPLKSEREKNDDL